VKPTSCSGEELAWFCTVTGTGFPVSLSTVTEVCGLVTVTLGVLTTFTSFGFSAKTYDANPVANSKIIKVIYSHEFPP
jgi:hypothetical protein